MFGFIRNKVSTLKNSLLMNAVKNDRRWAIKLLLWFGADCNATHNIYHISENNTDYHETILSYAIKYNKELALWLLTIRAVREQIKQDPDKQCFFTTAECIVNGYDHSQDLQIEQELQYIYPIDPQLIVHGLKQYAVYGLYIISHVIQLAKNASVLHGDENLVLRTAIELDLRDIAQTTLEDQMVREQLKQDMQKHGELSKHSVKAYLQASKLFCDFIDQSWVFNLFVQNIGAARVVPPPQPKLTEAEQIAKNHQDSIDREAAMLDAYKRQLEKNKATEAEENSPKKSRLGCTIS
jgi:hypothetical protein